MTTEQTCPLTERGPGYLLRCILPAGHDGDCLADTIEEVGK